MRTIWIPLVMLLLCSGCGSGDNFDRVEVSGTVTVNGAPLEQGRIAFLPMEPTPGPSTGAEIVDGHFLIPVEQGPAVGKHRIEILAMRPTGQKVAEGPGSDDPNRMVDEIEQFIPDQYNRQSTLTADVTANLPKGALVFDLVLPPK